MNLKLDENLGRARGATVREAGHDVSTVIAQGLTSSPDRDLARLCAAECRCLVSLDLDFANPLVFPPREHAGIAVLRLPRDVSADDIAAGCRTLILALRDGDIDGKLWIVQRGRIRQYQDPSL